MVDRVQSRKSERLQDAEDDFAERRAQPGPKRGTGELVSVGCKMPSGLVLRVFDMIDTMEPVMGSGSRVVKMAREVGRIELKGFAVPFGAQVNRPIFGRYGITNNVPKDLIEKWLEQNQTSEIVQQDLIFFEKTEDAARDHAKEYRTTRSGLEPLNVEAKDAKGAYKDPRMPRRIKKAETGNEDEEAA